jgi:nitrogen regulatory protein PII
MKMIWAIIQPEYVDRVIGALDQAGIGAMTRLHLSGSAGDNPPFVPVVHRTPTEVLMIAVPDCEVAKTVLILRANARPEEPGHHDGDVTTNGKIFVTYVDESFTIRNTGKTNAGPKS